MSSSKKQAKRADKVVSLTQASYDRIVEELMNAKHALEYNAAESGNEEQGEPYELEDPNTDGHEEWTEICTALRELET